METLYVVPNQEFILPECGFTAPEGMNFAGWKVAVEAQPAEGAEQMENTIDAERIYEVGDTMEQTAEALVESAAELPAANEQHSEETGEQTAERTEKQPAEVPVDAVTRTITFDAGGADGKMEPVQVGQGSEYELPECDFSIEGCTFGAWTVVTSENEEPVTALPGEVITVDSDLTLVAGWQIDEVSADENEAEVVGGNETDTTEEAEGTGLALETEETDLEPVDDGAAVEDDEPTEIGGVFSGAGITAIIAAVVLVIAAAGITIAKRKKK